MFGLGKPQQPIGETVETEQQNVTPFYSDQSSAELGKIMIDSSDFVRRVKYQLMGFVETSENNFEPIGFKLMNERGASWIATMVDVFVRKETYLTNIDDTDVIRITKDLWRIIDRAIIKNHANWEMSIDQSSMSLSRAIAISPIYFSLRRGENAEEKKFFAKTHESKVISRQDARQQQSKSFWG